MCPKANLYWDFEPEYETDLNDYESKIVTIEYANEISQIPVVVKKLNSLNDSRMQAQSACYSFFVSNK